MNTKEDLKLFFIASKLERIQGINCYYVKINVLIILKDISDFPKDKFIVFMTVIILSKIKPSMSSFGLFKSGYAPLYFFFVLSLFF
jgi:hypothetical protein